MNFIKLLMKRVPQKKKEKKVFLDHLDYKISLIEDSMDSGDISKTAGRFLINYVIRKELTTEIADYAKAVAEKKTPKKFIMFNYERTLTNYY